MDGSGLAGANQVDRQVKGELHGYKAYRALHLGFMASMYLTEISIVSFSTVQVPSGHHIAVSFLISWYRKSVESHPYGMTSVRS